MAYENWTREALIAEVEALRRRRTEEALREQKERLRILFEETPVGVTESDLDGHWIRVNRRFCEIVGYSREELRAMRYQDLTHPDDLAEDEAMARRVLEGGRSDFSLQKRYIRKDGEVIWVSLQVALMRDPDGEPDYFIAVVRDITEQREMEARLRRQERLAAVGQLAAGIAHDFRNLLSTIILNGQLLLRDRQLSARAAQRLQTMVDESYRATDLVQQILDFSGRSMLEPQSVDLAALARKRLEMLRRTLPESIRLELEVSPGQHDIEADPVRLGSVLTNLALNARDAMPDGGLLRVSLAGVEIAPGETPPVSGMAPGSWVRLTVSDTGIGMTEEVRSHLFEPFFTTKPVGEGTGLGLAQVFGIVQQHHGHIDVETVPGEGSTFHLYLPAGERHWAEADEDPSADEPRGQGELILLVEDEEPLREAGEAVLASLGYCVKALADGSEALAYCQSPRWAGSGTRQVALVITDLVMPRMGGRALLRELRSSGSAVPVLAVTGYALREDDRISLRDAGFAGVLAKPLDVPRWARAIRRALDG